MLLQNKHLKRDLDVSNEKLHMYTIMIKSLEWMLDKNLDNINV